MKAIRVRLIHIPGQIVQSANRLWIRVSRGIEEIIRARERMRGDNPS